MILDTDALTAFAGGDEVITKVKDLVVECW